MSGGRICRCTASFLGLHPFCRWVHLSLGASKVEGHCCCHMLASGHTGAGLLRRYGDSVGSVAVLSPYKAQVRALRALFQNRHGARDLAGVTFATIDGFQVSACCNTYRESEGQSRGRFMA